MDEDGGSDEPVLRITRENLLDGSLIAYARSVAPPDMRIRTDAELDASLAATLATHDPGEDVELFAYGSLIWNPVVHCAAQTRAVVHGWHRKFCLHLTSGRGSPEQPGLMLALDRGGACVGVSLRIPAAIVREELALVWRREMFTGSYDARWLHGRVGDAPARLLTFVANRAHPRYIGNLDEARIVRRIASARGHLGSNREYLEQTVAALRARGLRDANMQRLLRLVAATD